MVEALMKRLTFLALTFGLAACGTIAGPPALTTGPFPTASVADTPIEAAAGAYTLDPRHTSVIWRVRHQNMSMFTGRFDDRAGALTLDPAAPTKSTLSVTLDLKSIDAGLKGASDAGFNGEIAKVLGVEKTPKITFVSKQITRTGPRTGLVSGDLTMNGVTKSAVLETTFENYVSRTVLESKPTIAFSAHAVIKRSDWGASNTVFSLFAGDEVEIIVESELIKD